MIIRITSLLLAVFFLLIFFVSSRFSYKHRFNETYSMRNRFPFEFNYNGRFSDNFYGNSGIILSIFASFFFLIFFDTTYSNGLIIASMICGIICFMMIGVLAFMPMKLFKLHFIFASLFFASIFLLSGFSAIAFYQHYQLTKKVLSLVCFFVGLFLTLATFVLLMNPKLTRPIKGVEKENENGEKVMIRPKYIVLAFTEWLLIIIAFLDLINMFLFSTSI